MVTLSSYCKYFPQYKADIFTKNIRVYFKRLFKGMTDIMSDSPQKDWEPQDDFIVTVEKIETTEEDVLYDKGGIQWSSHRVHQKIVDSSKFHITDKFLANQIWKYSKKFDNYDKVVAFININNY